MTTRTRQEIILFVVVGCLLVNACSSTKTVVVVDESIFERVDFVNFSPQEELAIREAAASLFTRRCAEAFERAGLRTPFEVLSDSGVIMRPSKDLYTHSASALGLVHDQIRKTYADQFSSCRAQAGTIPPTRYGVQLTTDGKPRIFLHDKAFVGESFWLGTFSLRDVLTHEFIHAGGQQPKLGRLPGHDLRGYEPHDSILEACR